MFKKNFFFIPSVGQWLHVAQLVQMNFKTQTKRSFSPFKIVGTELEHATLIFSQS